MKLRTLTESLAGLEVVTQDNIIREAPHVPIRPRDIPRVLYPLTLGNYVDFGMEDYPLEYAEAAGLDKSEPDPKMRWARAVAGNGVRFPDVRLKIRAAMMAIGTVEEPDGSEPVMPADWRGYIQVLDIEKGEIVWCGKKVRKDRKVDISNYVDDGEGYRLAIRG